MTATSPEELTTAERAANAERAAKRNRLIAIITVGTIALLLATLFFGMLNAMQTARAQVDTLKGQLEACKKKLTPPPSLPAAPAPATGNGSCVKQETHVTIYGSSKPSASEPKVQKKAPTSDKAAPPKKEAVAPVAKKVWGNIPHDATPANPKKCFTSQAVSGSKPNSCSEVEVEAPWVKGQPRKDGTLAPFTEDEEAWTKRMADSYGIAIGKNLGGKAISGLNVNQENPK